MGMKGSRLAAGVAGLLLALTTTLAAARPSEDDFRKALQDAVSASKVGPADVTLSSQAVLHLREGQSFVPKAEAVRMLQVMGNPGDEPDLLGIIMPDEGPGRWFTTVEFRDSGYVKDDDAKNWNAGDLLKSYREGTEESNKEREKMGVPGLEIIGWAEPPKYDAASHRLVWSMSSREIGAPANQPQGVNYNTYALGRDGYFIMNMVTDLDELPQLKSVADAQLAALEYNAGKRYADFDKNTDHVAEYGLAALVVGVAAHKLGFLALAGAFVLKFAKLILIAFAGLGGAFMKFFRRKPAATAVVPRDEA
jgi:uncharacterized membrane-anchored protein